MEKKKDGTKTWQHWEVIALTNEMKYETEVNGRMLVADDNGENKSKQR